MKCKNCGYENPEGSSYCIKCGEKLDITKEAEESKQGTEDVGGDKSQSIASAKRKKLNKAYIIIFSVIAAFVILLIGFVVVMHEYRDYKIKTQAAEIKSTNQELSDLLKADEPVLIKQTYVELQSLKDKEKYPDLLKVVFKNKSNKTIKDFEVGFLAYDRNGYPLALKCEKEYTGHYEILGTSYNKNITPGSTYGDKTGWPLKDNNGISKVIACMKDVKFTDGSTWVNPQYDSWIEKYKEKHQQ